MAAKISIPIKIICQERDTQKNSSHELVEIHDQKKVVTEGNAKTYFQVKERLSQTKSQDLRKNGEQRKLPRVKCKLSRMQ